MTGIARSRCAAPLLSVALLASGAAFAAEEVSQVRTIRLRQDDAPVRFAS